MTVADFCCQHWDGMSQSLALVVGNAEQGSDG